MKLPNKWYDILKWIVLNIPACIKYVCICAWNSTSL